MQKAIRIIAVALVILFIGSLVIYNVSKPTEYTVWNSAMTKGDKETAENHFIMYTDIFCPYCDKFSNALHANEEDFNQKYIEDKKVLFEVRVTDMNYKSGHSNNSLPAGEGAYCAAKQDKFWDYYKSILDKVFADYHSKGIGVDKTSPRIPDLEMSYFYDAAETAGVEMDSFKTCMENHETLDELDRATARTGAITNGVPYFVFNKYTTSGFAGNWDTILDYQQAKLLLDAGLASKK